MTGGFPEAFRVLTAEEENNSPHLMRGRGCLLDIWWDISRGQKDCMAHPLDPFFMTGRNEREA